MADVLTLKRRAAAFYASGQDVKARQVEAEIVKLRGGVASVDDEVAERVEPAPVQTATADLGDVEVAAAPRRGPGRPRKSVSR